MMRRTLALVLSFALAFPVSAVDLPDLGDVAASELSPLTERRIGRSIMQDIRARDPAWLDDPEVEDYLEGLGRRLAAASPNPQQSLEFFAIRDRTLNAFALPGGYIGVHTGLILAAESESELASVLGHEISHVTQRHIAQLVGKQSQASMVMLASVLLAILAARSNSQVSEAALAAGQAGALQSQLGYTRELEQEADRVGLQTLERAGFDVRGMPSFFERLQRAGRLYENDAPDYLRTHPLTTSRIADMGNRVSQMRYRQVVDSSGFRFVRAKLRAASGMPLDTLKALEVQAANDSADAAARYALARAQLRAGKVEEARRGAQALLAEETSPFVATLAAEAELAARQPAAAIGILRKAHTAHPSSRSLRYALADALLAGEQADEAAALAREGLQSRSEDLRLWQTLARANAALGKRAAQHRAQAEVYTLQGALPAAIEQLEIGRRAGDADFYELSAMDARLRELKALHDEERRQRQQ
ncbi:beta-barrel assembly-enhancing protease [Pseudothauera rhizosphaerae]|uniref:M48 family metallopeptidase n=1 Tax=Pseudothauera rhizosphaerae TaxID=2565932 RepID=A0A4S4AH71_9RHOO|nr:M48 family metalloprotease [Pseudothauera rhizosphaerae]THF58612.1 M48 family metallopeptidase [Pseudothauera rhizosphaerae]